MEVLLLVGWHREGPAHLKQIRWAHRLERIGQRAKRLFNAAAEFRSEAQRKRSARLRQEIAHPLEAEDAQV